MNFYGTIKEIAGRDMTDGECMRFAIDQWGLIVSWLREHQGEITGGYAITSVHRDDLASRGYSVKNISNSTMKRLANKMGDAYVENCFWDDLEIIADDLEIPHKKK